MKILQSVNSIKKKNWLTQPFQLMEIERTVNKVNVSLHTAKPGMVIGKVEQAPRAALNKLTGKQVHINIIETRPDLDALVGEELLVNWNNVLLSVVHKTSDQRAMRAGAKGIKTQVSGRLNGADNRRVQKDTLKELFPFTHFALISITLSREKRRHYLRVTLVLSMDLPW